MNDAAVFRCRIRFSVERELEAINHGALHRDQISSQEGPGTEIGVEALRIREQHGRRIVFWIHAEAVE